MKLRNLGEDAYIRRIARSGGSSRGVLRGIGDDAAVIRWTAGKLLLFASDMLIENIHFTLQQASPYQVGRKALAVNISDIAAMGGVPKYALVSLGIDPERSTEFIRDLYRGMRSIAKKYHVAIVGGDTSASKTMIVDVSIIGETEKGRYVTRNGARPGDIVLVSGSLGGPSDKHLTFIPRVSESRWLVENFHITSMMDISDGLLLDLSRILSASGVGAKIYASRIPVSGTSATFKKAVENGEDFELLFTMRPKEADQLFKKYPKSPITVPFSIIGEITSRNAGFRMVDPDGKSRKVLPRGYTHF
ncbi:MAG: thiamine-phosphate kinase [Candidatus Omnitrophota bacterium]